MIKEFYNELSLKIILYCAPTGCEGQKTPTKKRNSGRDPNAAQKTPYTLHKTQKLATFFIQPTSVTISIFLKFVGENIIIYV